MLTSKTQKNSSSSASTNSANRAIYKNLSEIKALQAERTTARRQALEEAKLLAQLDLLEIAGTKEDQKTAAAISDRLVNGFVFSTAEINLAIDRDNRLKLARDLNSTPAAPPKRLLVKAA